MSDEDDQTLRSDQRLAPLFALAASLGVVGYIWAFRTSPDASSDRADYRPDIEQVGGAPDARAEPAVLQYRSGRDRRLAVSLHQRRGSGETLRTRVHLGVEEVREARDDEAPGAVYRRRFDEVDIDIDEGDQGIGSRITEQVESMVRDVESVVEVNRVGALQNGSWTSLQNPEVRQTLRMVRHAFTLLRPRPRRGALRVGDQWSYRLGAEHLESSFVESIEGDVRIRESLARFAERDGRRHAVIERNVTVRADGRARLKGDEETRGFEVSGEGSGRVWFDVAAGGVTESRLRIRRTLTFDGPAGERPNIADTIEWKLREIRGAETRGGGSSAE